MWCKSATLCALILNLCKFDTYVADKLVTYLGSIVCLFCDWCKMNEIRRCKYWGFFEGCVKYGNACLIGIMLRLSILQIVDSIHYGVASLCIQLCVQGVIFWQPLFKFISINSDINISIQKYKWYVCKSKHDIPDCYGCGIKIIIRKVLFVLLSYLLLK